MIKIGVIGAGHLGKIHIKLLKEIDKYELVGFYDASPEATLLVEKEFGIKHFETIEGLLAVVDAVDIVTPTFAHYECASKSIRNSKHVFIEKPITNTIEEAIASGIYKYKQIESCKHGHNYAWTVNKRTGVRSGCMLCATEQNINRQFKKYNN